MDKDVTHTGVMGMHWGVRNDKSLGGAKVNTSIRSTLKKKVSDLTPDQKARGKRMLANLALGAITVGVIIARENSRPTYHVARAMLEQPYLDLKFN